MHPTVSQKKHATLGLAAWYIVILHYISASSKRTLRNNIDVINYFAGDNEIYG